MDDRRTTEGVEHLQAAARELLSAARAFLDVVEEVVEDPERVSNAAHGVSDLLRSGLGLIRTPEPWERSAWAAEEAREEPAAGRADTSWWDEPFEDDGDLTDHGDGAEPPAEEATAGKSPAPTTPATKAVKKAATRPAAEKAPAAKKATKKAAAKKPPSKKAPSTKRPSAGAAAGTPPVAGPAARPSRVRRIAVD